MTISKDEIVRGAEGQWLMRAERALGGHSAKFELRMLGGADGPASDSPYKAYAGARAWLALAQDREAARDAQAALEASRAGLAELGENYGVGAVVVTDDTSIHIDLAEDLAERGQWQDAAGRMIGALEDRLGLYARQHADAIGE